MRCRDARIAENSARVALTAMLSVFFFALALLLSVSARAQESTTAKNTGQTKEETTSGATETGETTVQAKDKNDEDESSVEAREEASSKALEFAEGRKVAPVGRARQQVGGPLVGTPVETYSTDSGKRVSTIIIRRPDCKAEEGASFDLEDGDRTLATFTDRDGPEDPDNPQTNIQINETLQGLQVTSDSGNNVIVPINVRGGDGVLVTRGLKVASSTGIACERESGNAPPASNPGPTARDGCSPVVNLDTQEPVGTLRGTDGEAFTYTNRREDSPLRIAYATSSENGTLRITVTRESGGNAILNRTIRGATDGVLSADTKKGASYDVEVLPTDQGYAVRFQVGEEGKGCVNPESLDPASSDDGDVLTGTVPDDDLPDTGGLPVFTLAGFVALLLVVTSLIGVATARRGR